MTKRSALLFPNQLFADNPALSDETAIVWLVEEELFFGDPHYPFKPHKQKLLLHFASMNCYQGRLQQQGYQVQRVSYIADSPALIRAFKAMVSEDISDVDLLDPVDFLLKKRVEKAAEECAIGVNWHKNPGFLNTQRMNQVYRDSKSRWFMADYYQWQRKRLNILMEDNKPIGGSWSYDKDNRKKIPNNKLDTIPSLELAEKSDYHSDAIKRIERDFASHPGSIDKLIYPVTHEQAQAWLDAFLQQRFAEFGPYEDAIVAEQHWLYHSVLTPALNIGLLTPKQVVQQALDFAKDNDVPLNSLEGFIRQIIGWREFMRATYNDLGVKMRTRNHWQHHRALPACFYTASTGIAPVDDVINKVLNTGYCHHIERLMVIGGFCFLCEIKPDSLYRWFMDMFVDSYDWVMVPNVYAMSQHADGGLITTKPYFCGSNYILKMSNHKKGPWCEIWDALYWRWIILNQQDLGKNPRWAMMCHQVQKMPNSKQQAVIQVAEDYLASLDGESVS